MKRLFAMMISGLFIACTFQTGHAQTEKGNWLLSGSGSFQQLNYGSNRKSTSLQFYPKGGLFVTDNLVIGLMPSFDIDISKDNDPNSANLNTYNLSIGPFIRYYFPVSSKVKLFSEGYFTYGRMFYKPSFIHNDYNLYKWRLAPGIAFFLSNTVSIDASLGFGQTGQVEKGNNAKTEFSTNITDIQIGFSIYLFNK